MIKGADKTVRDNDGRRPIDFSDDLRTPAMRSEIVKLLEEKDSLLRDCLMIKTPLKKQGKHVKTLIAFVLMMSIAMLLINCVVYPTVDLPVLQHSCTAAFIISMVLCVLSWLKDPGYIQKDHDLQFMTLLEKFEPNCLCPECEVIRTNRSRHCNICNRCVDRFDHHCPWINNCVGIGNHGLFYTFIAT